MATSINTNGINLIDENKLNNANSSVLASQSGIGQDRRKEPIPTYIQADAETAFQSTNINASIVLGNDRPGNLASGHGGKGDTQCATIDIVAGRASLYLVEESSDGKKILVNPNIRADAARIYISQKTDIDSNFGLADGRIGNSKNKSAIALKADGIRVVAREGIKLITKTDFVNSNSEQTSENNGIEIIALNDDTNLQPMVLGNNLESCLNVLITEIDNLQNRVAHFIENQQKFNNQLQNHSHVNHAPGLPSLPSAPVMLENLKLVWKKIIHHDTGLYFQKTNFLGISQDYLSTGGSKTIKSKYNKVN